MTPGAEQTIAAIRRWRTENAAPVTIVVAIDGYGASGKTTLAGEVAAALGAAVVHTDDHFHPALAGTDARPMAQYYDWTAVRGAATGVDSSLILVEGVSAAAPALADLITHSVLVDTPEPVRLERLHARIRDEDWDEDWLAAERVYFASLPSGSFDLVVSGL